MRSFLVLFYILDQAYDQCEEDDLGGLLGAMSPELWGDGQPIDKAIFNNWKKISNPELLNEDNIIKAVCDFLDYYEKKFGFYLYKTKQWITTMSDKRIIKRALDKSEEMYQRFNYDS